MTTPLKDEFLRAIAKVDTLCPAPQTLSRALQLLRDPESGLHTIAELIASDPALAADVLRCANSAYFGRAERIGDLGNAVHVIGFHQTIRLVGLVATHHATHRDLKCYGVDAGAFWAESLLNGLFLETLADTTLMPQPGEAYTAGLLRLVGRLAIDQTLEQLGGNLFWDGRQSMLEWERENVGLTHSDVGAWLLKKWCFPNSIAEAVELQDSAGCPHGMHDLVLAMHFTARLLPAGQGVAAIETLRPDTADIIAHPFAAMHAITPEHMWVVIQDTRSKFSAVVKSLYP